MNHHTKQLKRYENPNDLRFLTFSCYRRLPLFGNDAIKDAFVQQLDKTRSRTHFHLIAWVIMPEHVHLLLWPAIPLFPVSKILLLLKKDFARKVIARWKQLNAPILDRILTRQGTHRFWQHGGGYDRNIHSSDEQLEKIRYIHDNPVRRGLVHQPTHWAWSSARWYDGDRSGLRIDPLKKPVLMEQSHDCAEDGESWHP